MKAVIVALLVGLVLGAGGCYFWLRRATVPLEAFRAEQAAHHRALALGLDYRAERDAHARASREAEASGDSLRRLRPETRTAVLSRPDSAARAYGLHTTAPDSLTRCMPVRELAGLIADKAELELCDSASVWDSTALTSCKSALTYSDSAETVAREDAERLHKAGEGMAKELSSWAWKRWAYAGAGAAVAVLAVVAGGSL